jgi:hypothetical protein
METCSPGTWPPAAVDVAEAFFVIVIIRTATISSDLYAILLLQEPEELLRGDCPRSMFVSKLIDDFLYGPQLELRTSDSLSRVCLSLSLRLRYLIAALGVSVGIRDVLRS